MNTALWLLLWRGSEPFVEPPTPIATDHIIGMYTFVRPTGDDIVYQDQDGVLVVGRGFGPPATPVPDSSALIVGLYTYQDNDGEEIVQQEGSGDVKIRRGLA
jgi:hypothetical protein